MAISITRFRNAVSLSSDNLAMDVEIYHPQHGWIPYGVQPTDTDMTIDNDALLALIGTNFTPYEAPTQAELDEEKAVQVREDREFILTSVIDPLVSNPLRWAGLTEDQQSAWSQYRTDLLDISKQSGFPHEVVWPTQPS
jgi:hypothetical protein